MDDFDEIKVFVLVSRLGGFTAAAKEAHLTTSAVSKKIARLEDRIGAQLLRRTTRSLHLTEAGEGFLLKCEEALRILDDAKATVSQLISSPRGQLKINIPQSFGRHCVLPLMPRFLALHPDIRLDINMLTQFDTYDFDVMIRRITMLDENIASEVICESRFVICASPAYLASAGTPKKPDDLVQHEFLAYRYMKVIDTLAFKDSGDGETIKLRGSLVANNYDAIVECILQGAGIACVPYYIVHDDLRTGKLIELLPGQLVPCQAFSALYMKGPCPPKVRAFIDFLKLHLSDAALS